MVRKKIHIKKITQPIAASDFPFTTVNIIKFIEDIIKIFIPVFKNKDPEAPPPSTGTTMPTTTNTSSSS
ncbi:MAG TPA: hypothetical protein PLA12_00980 [Candidatus Hydrogenedens sp.]|nr:hypothetical protein [Candidatus Hydrogenedens sp.]